MAKKPRKYPSDVEIRKALVDRANEYCADHGIALYVLGKRAVGDNSFFTQVAAGRNFTIDSYRRCMAYMDANVPDASEGKPKRKSAA